MLRCYACGATNESVEAALVGARCACGEPFWFDSERVASAVDGWTAGRGVAAFADWLPTPAPTAGLAAAAGGTPLVREPALDADGARAYLKIEGTNPTGSFKDRGSAVGIAAVRRGFEWDATDAEHHDGDAEHHDADLAPVGADEAGDGVNGSDDRNDSDEAGDRNDGIDRVGTVSHGNMAASMAAHAASAGLECVVLVPADVSDARLARIAAHDPRIYRVDGDYGRLYYDALAVGRESGVAFVNSDAPLRVAGQKTTTLELLRSFGSPYGSRVASDAAAPDALVLPVSSGGHASGAWKAIRDARAAGLLAAAEVPRLYFVQAAACAPVARAARRDADRVDRLEPDETGETVAYSIANADPPSGTRALRAAQATGGRVLAVDDPAIRDAHDRLARVGYRVEPACATVLAAFEELRAEGAIHTGEDVALVATGVGYGEGTAEVTAPVVDRDELDAVVAGE
ncbi:MAG: pyridoxal-phosphate dependent enzyme [Halobaculum sp.]